MPEMNEWMWADCSLHSYTGTQWWSSVALLVLWLKIRANFDINQFNRELVASGTTDLTSTICLSSTTSLWGQWLIITHRCGKSIDVIVGRCYGSMLNVMRPRRKSVAASLSAATRSCLHATSSDAKRSSASVSFFPVVGVILERAYVRG